jgi:hypothetical protein
MFMYDIKYASLWIANIVVSTVLLLSRQLALQLRKAKRLDVTKSVILAE